MAKMKIILFVIHIIAGLFVEEMGAEITAYPEVFFEELRDFENNSTVLLIDVRNPSELEETGTIPGSINIPLATLANVLTNTTADDFKKKYKRNKPDKDTQLVFTCRIGRRSKIAIDTAHKLGYVNVKHNPGGWVAWESELYIRKIINE